MAPGNRSSLVGVQPLPVITENPDASPYLASPSPSPSPATTPLSQRRRSLSSQSPPPLTSQTLQRNSGTDRPRQPLQFPTSPPHTYIPPAVYAPRRHSKGYPSPMGPRRHCRQHSNSSAGAEKDFVPVVIPLPEKEKDWFSRRGGWWRLGLYFFLFVALAVGLGIGLSIGLKSSRDAASDSNDEVIKRDILGASMHLLHPTDRVRHVTRQFVS